jgi:DNA (cytosine-5)-methyltransferase 1
MPPRALELCAGVGGLSAGLRNAGWEIAGHAEIDAFARRVLEARFPGVPLYGDVAEMDGRAFVRDHGSVDLVSFGAPCQNLSVAGRREGIHGEKSSLFFECVRVFEETGAAYALYENVFGLYSSSKGADFAAVLTSLLGSEVQVPVDPKGRPRKWTGAGLVRDESSGRAVAWRTLDAQHWVPQRRRRVFVLAARAGGVDPAAVLLEWEGLRGDHSPGGQAGEAPAGCACGGACGQGADGPQGGDAGGRCGCGGDCGCGRRVVSFYSHSNGEDMHRERMDVAPPITVGSTRPETANPPAVLCYDARGNGDGRTASTITGDHERRVTDYTTIVFDSKQSGESGVGLAPTLRAMVHDGSHMNGGGQLAVVRTAYALGSHASCAEGAIVNASHTSGGPVGLNVSTDLAYTLRADRQQGVVSTSAYFLANTSSGGDATAATFATTTTTATISASNASSSGSDGTTAIVFDAVQITHPENRSTVLPGQPCPTLNAESKLRVARMRAFGDYVEDGTASALKARDYKDATDLVYEAGVDGQFAPGVAGTLGALGGGGRGHRLDLDSCGAYPVTFGVPRRLLPVECERLQGWEDNWTDVPDPETGKPASDSQRYRCAGNGVCTPVAEWVGRRLLAAITRAAGGPDAEG